MTAVDNISAMERLRIADPDTFVWVKGRLTLISPPPSDDAVAMLSNATIWGLSQEAGLGKEIAKGHLWLMEKGADDLLGAYGKMIRKAALTGPTLGRIVAVFLPPVLAADGAVLARFNNTLEIMQRKGTYTLTTPMEVLSALLTTGETDSALAYLDLLACVFAKKLTYNQSNRLAYVIPKAVSDFAIKRRRAQIEQLHAVASADIKLIDPYLDGMGKGLKLLDGTALVDFVSQALTLHTQAPKSSEKFLSLSSKVGKDACTALQRTVPLSHISGQLNRYLQARIGHPVMVKPLSALGKDKTDVPWVCSDGRHIYLPDEIDSYPTPRENIEIFKALSRLEAGFFECRSFDFDLEKAADSFAEVHRRFKPLLDRDSQTGLSDGVQFLDAFHPRALAADLFNLFEQARVALHLRRSYPGLMRQVDPILSSNLQNKAPADSGHLLAPIYAELVLARPQPESGDTAASKLSRRLVSLFQDQVDLCSPVEVTARLVCLAFDMIRRQLGSRVHQYAPLSFPFERRMQWDLVGRAFASLDPTIGRIKARLRQMEMELYRSDLRNRLAENNGALTEDDIVELILVRASALPAATAEIDLSELDLARLLRRSGAETSGVQSARDGAFCYPEWAHQLQDYLYGHTRVSEIVVQADGEVFPYHRILDRHFGLVATMRRAFELLKPEGLTLLRQWPEGDAFDYRALLDFAMDRRAGRIPSDRLFIKRLKQERDVAVMLLVDLSRSTANPISGGDATVLDVTKEALVLFCEALQVVGDNYAVAGFSGSGRLSVDFYHIKRFDEQFSDVMRARISALKPQRSTRMGAAIRHAAALTAQTDARVKMMIVVSDGFPNDIGYKSDYAIADTARSIQEARSRSIHVKAITVNVGSDPRLDDLYGRNHHHIIGHIRDLPDKLVRLYSALTRY